MANKNTTGNLFTRFKDRETRLVKVMDRRTKDGDDGENVNPKWNKYKFTTQGERVWSF
jgi:hypothetical protein